MSRLIILPWKIYAFRHIDLEKRAQRFPPTTEPILQPSLRRNQLPDLAIVRFVRLASALGGDFRSAFGVEEAKVDFAHGLYRADTHDAPADEAVYGGHGLDHDAVEDLGFEAWPPGVEVSLHNDDFGFRVSLDEF